MALEDILLRTLTFSPLQTKGDVLTHEELDQNIIELYSGIAAFGNTIAPWQDDPYTYIGGQTYYVSNGNNIWKFISPTDSTGDVPVDGAIWELSSIGAAFAAGGGIVMTIAQAIQAAADGDLVGGSLYYIIDAWDGDHQFYIRALAPTLFEPFGVGVYSNDAMNSGRFMKLGYDVNGEYTGFSDYLFYLYDPKFNNEAIQSNGNDYFAKMPFDAHDSSLGGDPDGDIVNARFRNNRLHNVAGTWTARRTHLDRVTARNCTINTSAFAGTNDILIFQAEIKEGATLTLYSKTSDYIIFAIGTSLYGAYFSGEVGIDASLTAYRAAFTAIVGKGKTIDTTSLPAGYWANGRYDENGSTLTMHASYFSTLNPDGSGIVDMTLVPWVGTIIINDVSASGGVINTLTGAETVKIYIESGTGDTTLTDSNDNLRLTSATIILKDGYGDWVEMAPHPLSFGKYVDVNRALYISLP